MFASPAMKKQKLELEEDEEEVGLVYILPVFEKIC
jgi:hypothetical protein